jgi:hypothetical protein
MRILEEALTFDDVLLVRPVIVLDKPPGGQWNYARIFPDDTLPVQKDTTRGWGDWLVFTDVSVVDVLDYFASPMKLFGRFGLAGVPFVMYRVGSIEARRLQGYRQLGQTPPSLHSPHYYPDIEPTLETGVRTMTAAALELLQP